MPLLIALLACLTGPLTAANGYAVRLRFWDSHGQPVAVLAYHIVVPSVMDPVRLTATQWDSPSRQRLDTTWTQLPEPVMGSLPSVAGVIALPRPFATTTWQLHAARPSGDSIATIERADESPLDVADISMSDLALGTTGNSVIWVHDGTTTVITLSDTIGIHDTLHVAYQVRSAAAHGRVRTTLTFTNITDPKHGEVALQAYFDGALASGVNEFDREIDLSHVRRGRYRLELQVGDLDGGGVSVRPVQFYLQ